MMSMAVLQDAGEKGLHCEDDFSSAADPRRGEDGHPQAEPAGHVAAAPLARIAAVTSRFLGEERCYGYRGQWPFIGFVQTKLQPSMPQG
jgi:hypothetical protein